MSPADRKAIDEAVARLVADAPPLSRDALEMLRRDGCPIVTRKTERGAA